MHITKALVMYQRCRHFNSIITKIMIPERRGTRPSPVTFKLVRWLPTHLEGFTSRLKVRGSYIGLLVRCVHDLLKKWVTGAQ